MVRNLARVFDNTARDAGLLERLRQACLRHLTRAEGSARAWQR